jgi:thiol-disulfide isomerase/thioredoxin
LKRNIGILAGVAVCMALLFASAVLNYRHRQAELAVQAEHWELTPEAATPATGDSPAQSANGMMPDGSPDLRGKNAPNFTLRDLDGKTVTLKDLRGKAVLINFWATWCAPCKIEIPWFVSLYQQYQSQGLVILGVDAEDAPVDEVKKSATEMGISYPVLLRGDTIGHQWGGLDGLPTSFYINRQGVIVDQTVGVYSHDEVEAKIKKMLGPATANVAQNATATPANPGKP